MKRPSRQRSSAFTLIELLAAISLLLVLMGMLFAVFNQASKAWQLGERRTELFQGARLALEMMATDMESAFVSSNATSGKKITFLTFENTNGVPGAVALADVIATPPNDDIFWIGNGPDTLGKSYPDLTEFGYFAVFATNDYYDVKAGYYYLMRHQTRGDVSDVFVNPTGWSGTPPIGTAVNTPLLENVLRFEVGYEVQDKRGSPNPEGTGYTEAWDNTTFPDPNRPSYYDTSITDPMVVLPRAMHVTMTVLDRRYAARVSAILNGKPLSTNDLARVPYSIEGISTNAVVNVLREGMHTFYRTIYLKNSQ